MSTLATIHLIAGTDRVIVRDIPALFADAIHGKRCEDDGDVTNDDIAWAATVAEYEEAIKHAVMHRTLVPRNAMTLKPMPAAVGEGMLCGIVTIPDLSAFVAQFDIGVTVETEVSDDETTETVGHGIKVPDEPPETKNWILLIRAEAAKRWKSLRKAGANPTKNNIKDDLAKWCRESGVLTDGDINPTAEYIYRHVLRDWKPPKS